MGSYILKRLIAIIALTFGITVVAFLIIRLIPAIRSSRCSARARATGR